MLEVKNLSKKFGWIYAVKDVSFTLKRGEIVGYLGPNGSGKTTTMKMLTGLLKPSEGNICFDHKYINNNIYSYKGKLGYAPESSDLYSFMSGYDYLILTGRLRKIQENILIERIDVLSDIFELGANIFNSISTYSKGMAQKIVLISSIIHNPELLFFDEPLSGLDIKTIEIFKELITLFSKSGKIILYSSHILETVEKLCDRVLILDKGSIVEDKPIKDIKEKSGKFLAEILVDTLNPDRISGYANEIFAVLKIDK